MTDTASPLRVTVWGENRHEQIEQHVRDRYPTGMHGAVAEGVQENLPDAHVEIATMDQPEHGLTEELLARTDVLTWWGHAPTPRWTTRSSRACTATCSTGWASSCCTPGTGRRSSRS